jgi:hypothetical protein
MDSVQPRTETSVESIDSARAPQRPTSGPTARPQVAQPRAPHSSNWRPGVAPSLFDREELLFLPGLTGWALNIPGVYHVYSRAPVAERQGWACAFHAMDNMRMLEGLIGNRNISDATFVDACRRNARTPGSGSHCDEQANVARCMGLQHMINLDILEGGEDPWIVFDTPTQFLVYENEDEETVGELAEQTRQDQEWQRLRALFRQSDGPICIHFCAGLMSHGEGHGITVSMTKNLDGEVATYIFDNVNEQEDASSQRAMRRHVEFIYQKLVG